MIAFRLLIYKTNQFVAVLLFWHAMENKTQKTKRNEKKFSDVALGLKCIWPKCLCEIREAHTLRVSLPAG